MANAAPAVIPPNLPNTITGTVRAGYSFWGYADDNHTDMRHHSAHTPEAFLKTLEAEALRNNYQDPAKVIVFAANLHGEADEWWQGIMLAPFLHNEAGRNAFLLVWEPIRLAFKKKYFSIASSAQVTLEFTRSIQGPKQFPSNYVQKTYRMVQKWAALRTSPVPALADFELPAGFWGVALTAVADRNAELEPAIIAAIRNAEVRRWATGNTQFAEEVAYKIIMAGMHDVKIKEKINAWDNKTPSSVDMLAYVQEQERLMPQYMYGPSGKPRHGLLQPNRTTVNAIECQDEDIVNDLDPEYEHIDAAKNIKKNKSQKKKQPAKPPTNQGQASTNNMLPGSPFNFGQAPGANLNAAAIQKSCTFCGRRNHTATDCRTLQYASKAAKEKTVEQYSSTKWAPSTKTSGASQNKRFEPAHVASTASTIHGNNTQNATDMIYAQSVHTNVTQAKNE